MRYDIGISKTLLRPTADSPRHSRHLCRSAWALSVAGRLAFFPRTDPGQFVINMKAPTGTRLELTDQYVRRVENDIRKSVPPEDLEMIVSNIGRYARSLVDLHQQFRTAHRLRAGEPEVGRHKLGSYRVHESRAAQIARRSCLRSPPTSRRVDWWIPS